MGILATTELGLNAPSGDGCFLASKMRSNKKYDYSINAPSGAGCFLTGGAGGPQRLRHLVLMHLLVLGAF